MYANRVNAQKHRNPCLSDLNEYLRQPGPARDPSRIVCLEFYDHLELPTTREVSVLNLHTELTEPPHISTPTDQLQPTRKGRIFVIEDASKQIIEELGTVFKIDPFFFASYIHQPWRKTNTQDPSSYSLPSRDKKQNFLPLQYHRTISFRQRDQKMSSLTRNRNHQRKVVVLPSMGGERVGLVQHCCSVMLLDGTGREWISIILVDASMSDDYISTGRHGLLPPDVHSAPFLGGCEDFSAHREVDPEKNSLDAASNRGMLNELLYHWARECPPMFDKNQPSLEAFSYYPLRIVAAEWVNYISVMGMSLREYELSTTLSNNLVAELEKLNHNLKILQGWRRRVLSTKAKMRRTIRFIKRHSDPPKRDEDWDTLADDYEFINTEISEHGERLEAMVPIVTSAVALIETRRSLTETENVTRLTVLALVFIPLSYVATLFSMAEGFGPSGSKFWVYFAVAIPITLVVGLVAKPPVNFIKALGERFRRGRTGDVKEKPA